MLELTTIFEFSRTHCLAICAFLVPANLLITLTTLILVFLQQPLKVIRPIALLGLLPPFALFFHIATWWMIGVVRIPTFILLGLGMTCIVINSFALIKLPKMQELFQVAKLKFRGNES